VTAVTGLRNIGSVCVDLTVRPLIKQEVH